MRVNKSRVCVICGVAPATTKDHVPPKAFFKGTPGVAKITVPACAACNNGASDDDEAVRFWIASQLGGATPERRALWHEGAMPKVVASVKFRERVLKHAQEVVLSDGTTRLAFVASVEVFHRVFDRITRGLYFHHFGDVLLPQVASSIKPVSRRPDDLYEMMGTPAHNSLGDGAFSYVYGRALEAPEASMWIFSMHDMFWMIVFTGTSRSKFL